VSGAEKNWWLGGGVAIVGAIAVGLLLGFFDSHRPIWSAFLTVICLSLIVAAYLGQRYFERHWRDVGDAGSDYRGESK
jgi:hypothetical protein